MVRIAVVVAVMLLSAGCEDRRGQIAAATNADGTFALRSAASALGGSWSDEEVDHFAREFDLVVVGGSARRARVDRLRRADSGLVVLAYTCGFDTFVDNALGEWMRREHPDWFLRDAGGEPVTTYRNRNRWALDPGHDGVRAFFADSARRRVREVGADGVWEDNAFPGFGYRNVAAGRRLERYADDAAWRAAVEGYLAALEAAVGREGLTINQVRPWTRHGATVMIEDFPLGGAGWLDLHRGFEQVAADSSRTTMLMQGIRGPDDPERAFAAASYLMSVRPGAWLGYHWPGGRLAQRAVPEHRLALGRPLGPARERSGVWYRDFERGRVLVNPIGRARPAPWPSGGPALPALGAGLAWRGPGAPPSLPQWIVRDGR